MKYGVGIDVSKGKSTVAIISVVGEVIDDILMQMKFLEDVNIDKSDVASLLKYGMHLE